MHVLYLHQYFSTPNGFGGTRSYELAQRLLKYGHQVTMVCSGINNEPRLTVPPGKKYFETEVDGIRCVPIAAAMANARDTTKLSGAQRMRQFLHFLRLAKKVGGQLEKPDIVFATHTPLTIGLAGMDLARRFDVPYLFEVRDLWPEAFVNIGAIKNRLVIAWLRRMADKIYHAADNIVALSPGMKEGILKYGVEDEKVIVIPNGSDLELFHPDVDRRFGRERLNLGDRFAAIYFGAMGHANGLSYAIKAAKVLKDRGRNDIAIVLHGHGGTREQLESDVRRYQLDNVIFSDSVPEKKMVAQLVASCDACLTIYRASKEHTWSPNKMFDGLAAGKPVLINVPGWLTETIENNGCGYGVDPERPEDLADKLERLAADPASCAAMSKNSRALAEREFARDRLAARLEATLERTLQGLPALEKTAHASSHSAAA